MAWRFRKRIKVIPGIYLNFSKSGISTTIGPKGLSINTGSNGTFLNTGIPGTGLYNRKRLLGSQRNSQSGQASLAETAEKLKYLLERTYDESELIQSESIGELTSSGLRNLKETIIAAHSEHASVSTALNTIIKHKKALDNRLRKLQKSIFKFLFKKKIERLSSESVEMEAEINELEEQKDLSTVELNIVNDDTFESLYKNIETSYRLISSCSKIWDITASKDINQTQQRSFASKEVRRVEVKAYIEHSGLIVTNNIPLKLQNKNGGDLFFYPGFVIIHEQALDFAILDYSEFNVEFVNTQFVESETVPADSRVLGHTWAKVNKDGSPDRRFRDNYQIPIANYGQINFSSNTGLNESYLFSNADHANLFYRSLREYLNAIKTANKLLNQFN